MDTNVAASLAFAASAAFCAMQLRTRLDERRAERMMRELAGVVPFTVPTARGRLLDVPHPLRERHRRRESLLLSAQLAPALELIVGHLRIGRNITAAMAEVTDSLTDPLRTVLVDAVEEARLGTPLSDSLLQVADRYGNRHLGVVASAIGLQARHGGSLVEILDSVHNTIEEEDRLQRDIQTLTADNRLSARVLLSLPPIVLAVVSLLNPGYASPLVTDPLGQRMSVAGLVLAFVGWRWLRRLASPEVLV
jgi:tight adherence protein B